jgi:acetoin utilization deacetylase AcuC-like enzyme
MLPAVTIAYISHTACLEHETGGDHPESRQRLYAIEDALISAGLMNLLQRADAPRVTREQLCRVHSAAYVDEIEHRIPHSGLARLDADTVTGPHSLEAARRAAGAAVLGVDRVMSGEVASAFCAIRPPGHHASRCSAMGFCIFNNVAVGAAHALAAGLDRVAIVDFDVHHGNGTESIFQHDDRVLLCSVFQHPCYPDTRLAEDCDHIVHAPLPAGAYSEDFQQAVQQHLLPALHGFRPELILVSAGFDAHFEDTMSEVNLLDSDYYWITREIMDAAGQHAEGRVVSTLEGGYESSALGRSVVQHIRALMQV